MLCTGNANLSEYDEIFQVYSDDLDRRLLVTQLHLLHSNLPNELQQETNGRKIKGIVKYLLSLSSEERQLFSAVSKLLKLILVMPATNAVSERSFSALRRLKTWLRSSMHQARLNWCLILHSHCTLTDSLDLNSIGNEFVCQNASRSNIFGKF